MIFYFVFIIWIGKVFGFFNFFYCGDFEKVFIFVVELNDFFVGWNLENVYFLYVCRFGYLFVFFNGCLMEIGFFNSLFGW